jgi:AcrR family transcriptional regulator
MIGETEPSRIRRRNPRGQGERLREDILEAADALLDGTRDASRLSLRGVARRVGIAATSVYLHFPDVDHLKLALIEAGFAELDDARDAASEGIGDPAQALLARSRAYARWALDHPGRYRLMFGPDLPTALAFDAVESPSRRTFETLVRSIERCQEAGLCPMDNASRVAMLVWVSVHGLVLLRMDRPHFPWKPLDEMVDDIVRRVINLNAFTKPGARTSAT